MSAPDHVPTVNRSPEKVRRDVAAAGVGPVPAASGDETSESGAGTMLTETVLVVNQKVKVIELHNEYAVYDRDARQIGAVRQVGQSRAKKVVRLLADLDQFFTHRLEIVDMTGAPVLALTRPAKILKSRVMVVDGEGTPVGEIVQENVVGKIHFALMAGSERVGAIHAQNWRAWNFTITDAAGDEVARITKTWEGLAKTMLTTADNYVLEMLRPTTGALRALIVAAALGIDTALKQDRRGVDLLDVF